MKWWPWGRTETRSTGGGYEASLLAAFEASATSPATAGATAALEAASGLIARCLASGTVTGAPAGSVTPATMAQIGRSLIRSGESVWSINVDPAGRVRLAVAGHHDVYGQADPASWTYRLSEYGPSGTTTRLLPAAAVVHVRYLSDPIRPWVGVGPLQAATIAGRLSAAVAGALADEAGGPRGGLLAMPVDGGDTTVDALKTTVGSLRGRIAFVQSLRTMHAGAPGSAPHGDWDVKRIGADPPEAEVRLLERAFDEVSAACGCPPVLFSGKGDGTAQRESLRRALHTLVAPIARLIAEELTAKLERPIAVDLTELHAADVQGRARSWRALVGAEAQMDPATAARIVGMAQDD